MRQPAAFTGGRRKTKLRNRKMPHVAVGIQKLFLSQKISDYVQVHHGKSRSGFRFVIGFGPEINAGQRFWIRVDCHIPVIISTLQSGIIDCD